MSTTTHYRLPSGRIACGTRARGPLSSSNVRDVWCGLCERTAEYKAALAAHHEQRRAEERAREDRAVQEPWVQEYARLADLTPVQAARLSMDEVDTALLRQAIAAAKGER